MTRRAVKQIKETVSVLVLSLFLSNTLLTPALAAGAVADSAAASANRPGVTEQNGAAVVNIVKPDAGGLSHNKYSQFDVTDKGLIFNNIASGSKNTQLAGSLAANSSLAGQAASVILNEVTSAARSNINGPIEIAGQKASLIIANPNGIEGGGFGFINADRVTLTTGAPYLDSGKLGFEITGGNINITGVTEYEGDDSETAALYTPGKLEILTRAARINAQLWAKDSITVVTGKNKIDYETGDLKEKDLASAEAAPLFALDIGALGGMYTGKIRLIGTEDGLGVTLAGEVSASETLTLDVRGNITTGSAPTGKSANLDDGQGGEIEAPEYSPALIYSGKGTSVKTTGDLNIDTSGSIVSGGAVSVTAAVITHNGVITAGEAVIEEGPDETEIPHDPVASDITLTAGKITGIGALTASRDLNLNSEDTDYGQFDITAERLKINGEEQNINPIKGEPAWPEGPDIPDLSDPLNNKNPADDTSKKIDLDSRDKDITPIVKEENLPITADTNIPAGSRPVVDKTDSGLDLIQIVGPDKNGLSKNYYKDFNINPAGLILNNSTSHVNTQLGGWIANNPNLLGSMAKTILNEITGANPSYLNGYIEVAGQTANVIIANPNALTVNGLGYINVSGTAGLISPRITAQGDGLNSLGVNLIILKGDEISNSESEIRAANLSVDAAVTLDNKGRVIVTEDTLITGGAVVNREGGLLYGEGHTKIDAQSVTNKENSSLFVGKDLTIQGESIENNDSLIYAGGETHIESKNIKNLKNSLINSAGDLTIKAEEEILNQSSNIESQNNIILTAATITNEKETFLTDCTITYETVRYVIPHLQQPNYYDAYRLFLRTVYTGTIIEETDTAKIFADKDISITVGDLHNHYSYITAGEDLHIDAVGSVENHGYQATIILDDKGADNHRWKYKKHTRGHLHCHDVYGVTRLPYTDWVEFDVPTTRYGILSANGTVHISAQNIGNKTFNAAGDEISFRTENIDPATARINANVEGARFIIEDKRFKATTDPKARYLLETNPLFTGYQTFLSSDYLYERLTSDPEKVLKRLGDGYYEQQHIAQQILDETGKRFIDGYTSLEEQYKYLLDNAVRAANEIELTPGVRLSKEQVAALKYDIVWLEEEEIDGETVLVPRVYLSSPQEGDLLNNGTLIIGRDVELFTADSLTNIGRIKADHSLVVTAGENITNRNGSIAGDDTRLSGDTIHNQGGAITGGRGELSARNIINQTTTRTEDYQGLSQTTIDQTAKITFDGSLNITADTVHNTGAYMGAQNLDLTARKITVDSVSEEYKVAVVQGAAAVTLYEKTHTGSLLIADAMNITAGTATIQGSDLRAQDTLTITATDSITITDDKDISESDIAINGKNYRSREMENHENVQASNVAADGDVTVTVEQGGLFVQASNITSDNGRISLNADDITVQNDIETHESLREFYQKTSGALSSKAVTEVFYDFAGYAVGSNISGKRIDINADSDFLAAGSAVIADEELNITAKNITVAAAEEKSHSRHMKEIKRSGVLSGGGFGITIGKERQKDQYKNWNIEQAPSVIGSVTGSVTMTAEEKITVAASDVIAGGDITMEAGEISLASRENTYDFWERHEYRRTGVTVSIGGKTINTISSVLSPIQRAAEANDSRTKALYGVKAGMELERAITDNARAETADDKFGGKNTFTIDVSIGTAKSLSETSGKASVAVGSSVLAGGDASFIAKKSDITAESSKIEAENILFDAQGDINLLAGQSTSESKTDSKSSSWSIGANIGFEGIGYFLSASGATGKIGQDGIVHNGTTVNARNTLSTTSGGDTNK
jgi:filamentous hemagglutinin